MMQTAGQFSQLESLIKALVTDHCTIFIKKVLIEEWDHTLRDSPENAKHRNEFPVILSNPTIPGINFPDLL